ncbi:MAG: hypothetical protein HY074_09180 [Deltaproteobacteria bacterium]|nr:hypothetical protein [Deltaproteobacteria bacterium]
MPQTSGVRTAREHLRQASAMLVEYLKYNAAAQKSRVRKTSVQAAALLVFGLAILVWFELTVFFALRIPLQPALAALVTLAINLCALGISNALVSRWKRHNDAAIAAREARQAAVGELRESQSDLIALKDEVVTRTTDFARERVVVPFERYKIPVAVGVTFVTGVVVARALFPVRTPAPATH